MTRLFDREEFRSRCRHRASEARPFPIEIWRGRNEILSVSMEQHYGILRTRTIASLMRRSENRKPWEPR